MNLCWKFFVTSQLLKSCFLLATLLASQSLAQPNELVGDWSLKMDSGTPAWLSIQKHQGETVVRMRLYVGSDGPHRDVVEMDGRLTFTLKQNKKAKSVTTVSVKASNGVLDGVLVKKLAGGTQQRELFTGKSIPEMPASPPDLSLVRFGHPMSLFNGKDLRGWRPHEADKINGWSVQDGLLVNTTPKTDFSATGAYANLRSDREFDDFWLHAEFLIEKNRNSGIYLRGMYEAQVVDRDSRMQGIQGVGAIFGSIAPTKNAGRPGGEWQTYDLTLVDRHITVVLNGEKVIDNQPVPAPTAGAVITDPSAPGPIYLQGDHTAVKYRNIYLAPVLSEPTKEQIQAERVDVVQPHIVTESVSDDADDPAIWVNHTNPSKSLILGTNKVASPSGAVVVYGLDGKTVQTIAGLDRPNNIDVEYGFRFGGESIDIAVVTERLKSQVRVYQILRDGSGLKELAIAPVFEGLSGEQAAPMGIAMYRRPSDGAMFAIVGRKSGPLEGYLWQYKFSTSAKGDFQCTKVRELGVFSGVEEIEAICVDDALGYVYYADEGDGIHKWHADPDHGDAPTELAHFGKTGFTADREGIAVVSFPDATGYIICTDQIDRRSQYRIYPRAGAAGDGHNHDMLLKVIDGGADSTDGIDVTTENLGPEFPKGLLVVMNSKDRNFLLYRWEDIAQAGQVKLRIP